jgi:hypothetical protein
MPAEQRSARRRGDEKIYHCHQVEHQKQWEVSGRRTMAQDVDKSRIANATTEREAHEETAITPEMAWEGARLLADRFGQAVDWWTCDIASELYLAMYACAPPSLGRKRVP